MKIKVVLLFFTLFGLLFALSAIYLHKVEKECEKEKERVLFESIEASKEQSTFKMHQLFSLFDAQEKQVVVMAKEKLQESVDVAYRVAHDIKEKYRKKKSKKEIQERIKETLFEILSSHQHSTIFISDYNANAVLLSSHIESEDIAQYLDADDRSIVYEEIQKVRRHQEGFIESRKEGGGRELIYVKDLEMYKWYIGSSLLLAEEREAFKERMLAFVKSIPFGSSELFALYEGNKELFATENYKLKLDSSLEEKRWYKSGSIYYTLEEYTLFQWKFIYGFERRGD